MVPPDPVCAASAGIGNQALSEGPAGDQSVQFQPRIKRFLRFPILYEFNPREKPLPSDVSNEIKPREGPEGLDEDLSHARRSCYEIVLLNIIHDRRGNSTGEGILAVGVAMDKTA